MSCALLAVNARASHSCSNAMQTVEQIGAFMAEHKDEKVIAEIAWEAKL